MTCVVCGHLITDESERDMLTRADAAHRRCARYVREIERAAYARGTSVAVAPLYFRQLGGPRFPGSTRLVTVELRRVGDEIHVIGGDVAIAGTPLHDVAEWVRKISPSGEGG